MIDVDVKSDGDEICWSLVVIYKLENPFLCSLVAKGRRDG